MAEIGAVVRRTRIPLRFRESGVIVAELDQHCIPGAGLPHKRIEQPFCDEGAGAPACFRPVVDGNTGIEYTRIDCPVRRITGPALLNPQEH
jgi:hypothetical protein